MKNKKILSTEKEDPLGHDPLVLNHQENTWSQKPCVVICSSANQKKSPLRPLRCNHATNMQPASAKSRSCEKLGHVPPLPAKVGHKEEQKE